MLTTAKMDYDKRTTKCLKNTRTPFFFFFVVVGGDGGGTSTSAIGNGSSAPLVIALSELTFTPSLEQEELPLLPNWLKKFNYISNIE
jgi:hypothetical protein